MTIGENHPLLAPHETFTRHNFKANTSKKATHVPKKKCNKKGKTSRSVCHTHACAHSLPLCIIHTRTTSLSLCISVHTYVCVNVCFNEGVCVCACP